MYIDKEIRLFIKAPTIKKIKKVNLINHRKILQVTCHDGKINYYWFNSYNLQSLIRNMIQINDYC